MTGVKTVRRCQLLCLLTSSAEGIADEAKGYCIILELYAASMTGEEDSWLRIRHLFFDGAYCPHR